MSDLTRGGVQQRVQLYLIGHTGDVEGDHTYKQEEEKMYEMKISL